MIIDPDEFIRTASPAEAMAFKRAEEFKRLAEESFEEWYKLATDRAKQLAKPPKFNRWLSGRNGHRCI